MAAPQRRDRGRTYVDGHLKRTLDLIVAVTLAIVTVPVVAALAIGSAIAFRAWPFFVQDRLGRHGERFRFVKVRSLPTVVPAYVDKHRLADLPTSRWGSLLRASHLDELPQLWLVVIGKMSLVGPRPEMEAVASVFDPGFVAERCRVRPGITGPWQVSTAHDGLIGADERFDLHYLRAASLGLDIRVLGWTLTQRLGAPRLTFERLLEVTGSAADLDPIPADLDRPLLSDHLAAVLREQPATDVSMLMAVGPDR